MAVAATSLLLALTVVAQPPDPAIEAARADAARYSQSIPNYLVKRTTSRYRIAPQGKLPPPRSMPEWRPIDSVSAEVASEEGREVYSDIRIDGKPSKALPRDGVWSNGEFSNLLEEVLGPKHAAAFTGPNADTTLPRPAWRYNFAIDQKHSGWDMIGDLRNSYRRMRIAPRYSGMIWIDRETGKVLRVEKSANRLPRQFPLQVVESETDYALVFIGEVSYMLPTHSETITCTRKEVTCFRNETVFENYRKFGASASITFGK
jgi:hypothetical protein